MDNLNCCPGANPLGSPLDNRMGMPPPSGAGGDGGYRAEDTTPTSVGATRHHHVPPQLPPQGHPRGRSSSSASIAISPLDFHFANHNAAIASASLPPKRKGSLPGARSEMCHRALSDWYYSQAGAANAERPGMPVSPRQRSISQDRLAELGLSMGNHHHHRMGGAWPHSASQDTLLLHYGAALGGGGGGQGQDSFWLGGWGTGGPTSRSCSENLLAAYETYDHAYERSLETLEQASALVSPRYERPPWPHHSQPMRASDRTGPASHRTAIAATVPPPGRTGQAHHHHHHHQQQHILRQPTPPTMKC